MSVEKDIGALGVGTACDPLNTKATDSPPPSLEYSLKAKVNWPGFMFHNRLVEATESYMWVLNGEDIGMVHDIKVDGHEVSIAIDKLRILT